MDSTWDRGFLPNGVLIRDCDATIVTHGCAPDKKSLATPRIRLCALRQSVFRAVELSFGCVARSMWDAAVPSVAWDNGWGNEEGVPCPRDDTSRRDDYSWRQLLILRHAIRFIFFPGVVF